MTDIGTRILERLEALGITQSELARRVGITQPAIANLIKRGGRSSHLHKIARALETTPEHLEGLPEAERIASPRPGFGGFPVPANEIEDEDDEIVEIQELDLAFGMGGGSYLDLPVKAKPRRFTRGWLRLFTQAPPTRIFIAQGIGDSMAPTIQNADICIIDTADTRVKIGDQIWAVAYGETGLIKRLRPMPDGGVKIMSDNPLIEAETAYDGELHVIGKVVAVVRRMAG